MATEADDKLAFAERQRELARDWLLALRRLEEFNKIYFANGWNSGGSAPIVDGDITTSGITATELGSWITLIGELIDFRDNAAVTTGDYGTTARDIASLDSVNTVF